MTTMKAGKCFMARVLNLGQNKANKIKALFKQLTQIVHI